MQRGHSESVSRGQPSGGLVFSQLLSSGLSLQAGVKPGFWPIWLSFSKANQAALAACVNTFSAYLIGLCIWFPHARRHRHYSNIQPASALPKSIGTSGETD